MKYLETILAFLTGLVRIIFPRRQKPAAGDCPCPHPYPRPLPDGDHPVGSLMEQTEVTLTAIGAILSLSTRATGEPNNVSNL